MGTLKESILVVLSVFVLFLASAGEHTNNLLGAEAHAEIDLKDYDDDNLPQGTLSIDIFNSVVQVSQLIFHSDLISEFKLPEVVETKAHSVFETALNFTKYYKTLFRLIISPNAP